VSILALTENWLTEESENLLLFLVIRLHVHVYVAPGQLGRAEWWPWSCVKTLYFIFLTSTLVQPIRLRIHFCIYPEGSGLDPWGDLPTLGSTPRAILSGNGNNSSSHVSQTQTISNRLRSYTEKGAILYSNQFRFRLGHSIDLALINIHELITTTIDTATFFLVSSYTLPRPSTR